MDDSAVHARAACHCGRPRRSSKGRDGSPRVAAAEGVQKGKHSSTSGGHSEERACWRGARGCPRGGRARRRALDPLARRRRHTEVLLSGRDKDFVSGFDGMLLLHAACTVGASAEVFELLLSVHPKSARIVFEQGNQLPLHMLAKADGSANSLHRLLSAHPSAAVEADRNGCLPLHHISRCRADVSQIGAILSGNPGVRRVGGSVRGDALVISGVRFCGAVGLGSPDAESNHARGPACGAHGRKGSPTTATSFRFVYILASLKAISAACAGSRPPRRARERRSRKDRQGRPAPSCPRCGWRVFCSRRIAGSYPEGANQREERGALPFSLIPFESARGAESDVRGSPSRRCTPFLNRMPIWDALYEIAFRRAETITVILGHIRREKVHGGVASSAATPSTGDAGGWRKTGFPGVHSPR